MNFFLSSTLHSTCVNMQLIKPDYVVGRIQQRWKQKKDHIPVSRTHRDKRIDE